MNEETNQLLSRKVAEAIVDSPALYLAYQPIAGTAAGDDFQRAIGKLLTSQTEQLKNQLAAMTAAKQAAEAEADAFMQYHEDEMEQVFSIREDYGSARMMFTIDRMQFEHARPERLEELVKLATVQTLEALLAGTKGREVFERLTRELVKQRMAEAAGK